MSCQKNGNDGKHTPEMQGGEMKIINENLPANDGNLDKAKRVEQRVPKKAVPKASSEVKAQGNREVQQWIAMTQSRIAKAQTIMNAFRQVATWIEKDDRQGNHDQLLSELIEKTQSRGERLLKPYRDELSRIMSQRDAGGLQTLIADIDEEIKDALGKNQTVQQNILAMNSNMGEQDLDRLLKKVVADLKSTGKLNVNLARDRIIDLLG